MHSNFANIQKTRLSNEKVYYGNTVEIELDKSCKTQYSAA